MRRKCDFCAEKSEKLHVFRNLSPKNAIFVQKNRKNCTFFAIAMRCTNKELVRRTDSALPVLPVRVHDRREALGREARDGYLAPGIFAQLKSVCKIFTACGLYALKVISDLPRLPGVRQDLAFCAEDRGISVAAAADQVVMGKERREYRLGLDITA